MGMSDAKKTGTLEDFAKKTEKLRDDLEKISSKYGLKFVCVFIDDTNEDHVKGGSIAVNTFGKASVMQCLYGAVVSTAKALKEGAEAQGISLKDDFEPDEVVTKESTTESLKGKSKIDLMLEALAELKKSGNKKLIEGLKKDISDEADNAKEAESINKLLSKPLNNENNY